MLEAILGDVMRGRLLAETAVASATTCDIGAALTQRVEITGTTTITSFGTVANRRRRIRFSGILTLTHNATTLILPTGANITTAAGDICDAESDASGNWRVTVYERANGSPLALASQAEARAGTDNTKSMTALRVKESVGEVFLLDVTVSNAATVDLTGVFTSTYDRYVIELDGLTVQTNDVNLAVRVGTGGTPTYQAANYNWGNHWAGLSSVAMVVDNASNSGLATSIIITATSTGNRIGNAANKRLFGTIEVTMPADTGFANISADITYNRAADNGAVRVQTGGVYTVAGAITAIRLLASSGNVVGGRVRVKAKRSVF